MKKLNYKFNILYVCLGIMILAIFMYIFVGNQKKERIKISRKYLAQANHYKNLESIERSAIKDLEIQRDFFLDKIKSTQSIDDYNHDITLKLIVSECVKSANKIQNNIINFEKRAIFNRKKVDYYMFLSNNPWILDNQNM